jgi:hypothetical protein
MSNVKKALLGATVLGALLLSATTASASIGPIGSFQDSGPAAMSEPRAIAVDPNNGDVYVVDRAADRVLKFDADGSFLLAFGSAGSGPGEFSGPAGVAVDPNTGDVYVGDPGNGRIQKFDSTGAYIAELDSGAGGSPSFGLPEFGNGLAVDPEGKLYVLDREFGNGVLEFDASGAYETDLGYETRSESLGVDLNGFVDIGGSIARLFTRLTPTGEVLQERALGQEGSATGEIAVDQLTGTVFAGVSAAGPVEAYEVYVYNSQGARVGAFPSLRGPLAYDTGDGRIYQSDPYAGEVAIYGTLPTPTPQAPTVLGESLSSDARDTATIKARVNPNLLDTTYAFQYATDPGFASAVSVPAAPADVGSGYLPVVVAADLTGLQQSTTYYYRVIAHNSFGGAAGTTVVGPTQSLTTLATPPSVSTGGVSEVTFGSAQVSGTVIPGSVGAASDTRWCFEYGPVDQAGYALGSLPLQAGDAGQGVAGVPVSLQITGLTPGSTYRYRLVAVNSLGLGSQSKACGTSGGQESDGADGSFTTPISQPPPQVDPGSASAVSQNAATLTGTVDPVGLPTTYAFQIGVDTGYGVELFGTAGEGTEPTQVSVDLQYLQPNTTYHFRLVAIGAGGRSYGADQSFTTIGFTSVALQAPSAPPLVGAPEFAFPTLGNATTLVKANAKHKAKQPKQARKRRKGPNSARKQTRRHRTTRGRGNGRSK